MIRAARATIAGLSRRAAFVAGLGMAGLIAALPATSTPAVAAEETTEETICRLIEQAADERALPVDFFTRLIWRESSFRPGVTSGAGAQGIAQFMPGTATERGLDDPFDPEQAIPASAGYLADLRRRFGNLGLAAAAYNAGPTRLSGWLRNGGFLPMETEDYVLFVTGRSVGDWRDRGILPPGDDKERKTNGCRTIVASIRTYAPRLIEGAYAPYGVQLSGNYSKARAIASYQRMVGRYPAILEGKPTLILGSRLAGRGRRAFYRVRLPAASLREAGRLCASLRKAGGACVVLRN